jgi:regulation of enolase protein 1 (concanavalin A-like superfamily)
MEFPMKDSFALYAPAGSDVFIDRLNSVEKFSVPFTFEEIEGDFVVSALITPEFHAFYDSGSILVMESQQRWIKLEFENTDLGYPSIVAVVTDGSSDVCNGERLTEKGSVYLQIIRKGNHWFLHYSIDGESWKMVRYFELSMQKKVKAGFAAQSPIGNGTHVTFEEVFLGRKAILDFRKGE